MTKIKIWSALFATNFLGVFNDNFLKNLVVFISVWWLVDNSSSVSEEDRSLFVTTASALLVAPYILFSPWAGTLAKTHYKVKIIRLAKIAELPIMLIACLGFIYESIFLVMFAIFLMGLQSCIFSPSKYGLIRDIGGKEGISFGTGTMEMLTFIGVLLGTFLAGVIADHINLTLICLCLLGVALIGWLASTQIKAKETPPVTNCEDSNNPLIFLSRSFKEASKTKGLNYVVLALCFFWFIGSMLQMALIVYCPDVLGMNNTETGMVMSLAAIGIGVGCVLAGILSNKKVEVGFVPFGSIGLSISVLLIFVLQAEGTLFSLLIFFTAFFSGFYKVPLNSWIQEQVKGRVLGEMIAYNNLATFLFILLSAVLFRLITIFLPTLFVFLFLAMAGLLITFIQVKNIPEMKKRFLKKIPFSKK